MTADEDSKTAVRRTMLAKILMLVFIILRPFFELECLLPRITACNAKGW